MCLKTARAKYSPQMVSRFRFDGPGFRIPDEANDRSGIRVTTLPTGCRWDHSGGRDDDTF